MEHPYNGKAGGASSPEGREYDSAMLDPAETRIFRASMRQSEAASSVMIRSRRANVPAIPAPIHTDEEITAWFNDVVMPEQAVWLAERHGQISGMLVLTPGWVEHLYVDPNATNAGIGSALIGHAKAEASGELQLWTFASNLGARRFYRRHGFIEAGGTDGDNEEQAPDVLLRWNPSVGDQRQ